MNSWWMGLGGTLLLATLSFGAGSWRSGRALDDAYDQGWRASDREAWRDGYEAGCDDTEASMAPLAGGGGEFSPEPAPCEPIDVIPAGVTPPNGSRLMNDHQVRAELAALAEDVPSGAHMDGMQGGAATDPQRSTGRSLRVGNHPDTAGHPASSITGPGYYLPAAITDTHWTRLVGREFFNEQRAWSDDVDWRLLTWAVKLMGREGAGKMLEAAR